MLSVNCSSYRADLLLNGEFRAYLLFLLINTQKLLCFQIAFRPTSIKLTAYDRQDISSLFRDYKM